LGGAALLNANQQTSPLKLDIWISSKISVEENQTEYVNNTEVAKKGSQDASLLPMDGSGNITECQSYFQ